MERIFAEARLLSSPPFLNRFVEISAGAGEHGPGGGSKMEAQFQFHAGEKLVNYRRTIMRAPDINCPYCGTPMIAGEAIVTDTIAGFAFFGLSREHLWFQRHGKKDVVMKSGGQCAGHRCPGCGAVIINPLTKKWDR